MRTAISLVLVTFALLIGNVFAAISSSNGWASLMMILSCFANAIVIAGIISTCPLRSSWIAYMITTGLFMLLVITRSESLSGVMQQLAETMGTWRILPPEDSSIKYFPVERIRFALESSCPPFFGVAAGFIAILFFPGKRLRKEVLDPYPFLP